MPVSDSLEVLSKLVMILGFAPLVALCVSFMCAAFVSLGVGIVLAFHGANLFGAVLGQAPIYLLPLQMGSLWLIYILWALPTVGWLMLVSAWARSKPFLWAIGLPVITGVVLVLANQALFLDWDVKWFWKHIVTSLLLGTIPGGWVGRDDGEWPTDNIDISALTERSWSVLAAPDLWLGVVAGVAMIIAAIRLRRWRDDA